MARRNQAGAVNVVRSEHPVSAPATRPTCMKKDAALHSPTAADLYDLRTRHVSSDFPALEKLIAPGSVVLEVGAGTGRVVRFLSTRGCVVIAVERDHKKVTILRERFGNDPRVRVVEADFDDGACSEKVD